MTYSLSHRLDSVQVNAFITLHELGITCAVHTALPEEHSVLPLKVKACKCTKRVGKVVSVVLLDVMWQFFTWDFWLQV